MIEKYKNEISRQISESNKSIEELQQTVEALSKKLTLRIKKMVEWLGRDEKFRLSMAVKMIIEEGKTPSDIALKYPGYTS